MPTDPDYEAAERGVETLRSEMLDIMQNPQNPKHKLYLMGDKATMAYIDKKYQEIYGTGKVVLGDGLSLDVTVKT
jgi:hypothetical protein